MFCKWYEIDGIKCQGKLELTMAENLLSNNITVTRGKPIKTPFGNYTPDFDCGDFFIEVKGSNSWFRALGQVALLENAKTETMGKIDNISQLKMEWTQDNIKPIYIWVSVENFNNDKYFNKLTENAHNLKRFTGTIDGFLKWLKDFI